MSTRRGKGRGSRPRSAEPSLVSVYNAVVALLPPPVSGELSETTIKITIPREGLRDFVIIHNPWDAALRSDHGPRLKNQFDTVILSHVGHCVFILNDEGGYTMGKHADRVIIALGIPPQP